MYEKWIRVMSKQMKDAHQIHIWRQLSSPWWVHLSHDDNFGVIHSNYNQSSFPNHSLFVSVTSSSLGKDWITRVWHRWEQHYVKTILGGNDDRHYVDSSQWLRCSASEISSFLIETIPVNFPRTNLTTVAFCPNRNSVQSIIRIDIHKK